MAASSVSGTGPGDSNKPNTSDLASFVNGPLIVATGYAESAEAASPPSSTNAVTFPVPLPGGVENYVIMLTTQNGGYVYVSDTDEDEEGNFTGFSFLTEEDCSVMYMVAKVGFVRPAR